MGQDGRPFHELPAIRRWGKKPAEERRTSTPGFPIRTGIIHNVEIIIYRTDPFAAAVADHHGGGTGKRGRQGCSAVMNPDTALEPAEWPIDGTLDLHLFKPSEVGELVPGYLDECRKRGILQVRIIHGKGTGQLRESVHAILKRLPDVVTFGLASAETGGWGATVVELMAEQCALVKGEQEDRGPFLG